MAAVALSRRFGLGGRAAVPDLWAAVLADVLAGDVIDDHDIVLAAGPVAHQDHVALAAVDELVERAAGDERRHAGLEHGRAAVGKLHRAFAFEAGEDLILVVAM